MKPRGADRCAERARARGSRSLRPSARRPERPSWGPVRGQLQGWEARRGGRAAHSAPKPRCGLVRRPSLVDLALHAGAGAGARAHRSGLRVGETRPRTLGTGPAADTLRGLGHGPGRGLSPGHRGPFPANGEGGWSHLAEDPQTRGRASRFSTAQANEPPRSCQRPRCQVSGRRPRVGDRAAQVLRVRVPAPAQGPFPSSRTKGRFTEETAQGRPLGLPLRGTFLAFVIEWFQI